jgi:hypothetical protein
MKVTTALRGEPGGPFPAIVSSAFRETPRPSKAAGGGTEGSNPSSSSEESCANPVLPAIAANLFEPEDVG